ncbi:hypothetical protein A9Q84_10395 [Halobacteriovorax marinus]|uniref:Multidrug-efflux transporter n=1 Tax=Halobacteriovorax marinus TaxID=97084 RepID=A0A1Y5FBA6_9BACT|nr:hypothetical protein A9Q84_10395 [Halobacteriovorax marinus]
MKSEITKILKLSTPIIFAQIGVVLLGVVDMVMLGNYSETALKAAGLANVWVIGTLMFGIGCCLGVDPIISQALGQKNDLRARSALVNGKIMAIGVSVVTAILWLFTGPILMLFGQNEIYANLAHDYALVQIPSLIPFFMYMIFRQYMIGHEKAVPVAVVLILTNVVNIFLNWLFIYGGGIFSPMGLFGAGLSTCLMRACQYLILCLIVYYSKRYKSLWEPFSFKAFDKKIFKSVLFMGIPIGIHLMLEAFGLQLTIFFSGMMGESELASHSILINLAYLFFVLPMAFSLSAAMRVGHVFKKSREELIHVYQSISLISLLGFLFSSAVLWIFGEFLIRSYGVSEEILLSANQGIFFCACFLFFYGIQLVGAGLLRGAGITLFPSLLNIISLYVIALPLCYFLSIKEQWGINGLWLGLMIGMIFSTVLILIYSFNFLRKSKDEFVIHP